MAVALSTELPSSVTSILANQKGKPVCPYLSLMGYIHPSTTSPPLSYRYAYIEFADKDSINNALALDESLFRGRQIKVDLPQAD